MKNLKNKIFGSLIFVSVLIFGSSCKKEDPVPNPRSGKYTYRTTLSAPATLSPTDYTTSSESEIIEAISSPLYAFDMNSSRDGYQIVCELATELPLDLTKEYAGKKPYDIPSKATEGYAWRFTLRQDACWENGTPITADTVEYSLKQFLSPDMKNFRATDFYETLPIANAAAYAQGSESYKDIFDLETKKYAQVPESEMYVSLNQCVTFFGDSIETYYKNYTSHFIDKDGINLYEALAEIVGEQIYAPLTENMKPILLKIAESFGDTNPEAYKEFCFSKTARSKTPWENVGFIKDSDYSYTLILSTPLTAFMAAYRMNIPLLYEPIYEACKTISGGLIKSSYGTKREKTISYGPYLIAEYIPGKNIKLEKNESWYGWKDGKHEGQYASTGIDIQFIEEHSVALQLFEQGKLDEVFLTSADLEKYGTGVSIERLPSPYTYSLVFNSDKKSLKRREKAGVNKTLLSYEDFRHAISLCIDREKYVNEISPSSEPAQTLISRAFIGIPESGKLFRDTNEAKEAILEFTNAQIASDAHLYFQKAYEEALSNGDIKEGDSVEIDLHVTSNSEMNQKTSAFIQDSINEACKTTQLAGKIKLNLVVDENCYDNMKKGLVDLAIKNCGGDFMNPYAVLSSYCESAELFEYGFDPRSEKLEITLENEKITRTFNAWCRELNGGIYADSTSHTKNQILAQVEKALLESYRDIPLRSMNSVKMISPRIEEGSSHFINPIVGFGGIRCLKYTMDDAAVVF